MFYLFNGQSLDGGTLAELTGQQGARDGQRVSLTGGDGPFGALELVRVGPGPYGVRYLRVLNQN